MSQSRPVTSAGTAQAAVGGGGCRTAGWAGTTPGVLLDPCSDYTGNSIFGYIQVQNPNALNIDICAQLLRVNSDGSTTQVHSYGCFMWTQVTRYGWNTPDYAPGYGTYVVQTGYWYAGNYWGGAQSARITVY